MKSRTLRAEIDLKNPGGQLLPGVYAYVNLMIERPACGRCRSRRSRTAATRPITGRYENGRAVRTEVQTGVSDGEWIEVTNRQVCRPRRCRDSEHPWVPIDGTEQVILGDLSLLTDGAPVAGRAGDERGRNQ